MKVSGQRPLILLRMSSTLGIRVIKGYREELIIDHKSAASNLLHMLLLQLLPDLDWVILYALYVDALAGREREGNETSSLAGFLIPGFNLLIILGRQVDWAETMLQRDLALRRAEMSLFQVW